MVCVLSGAAFLTSLPFLYFPPPPRLSEKQLILKFLEFQSQWKGKHCAENSSSSSNNENPASQCSMNVHGAHALLHQVTMDLELIFRLYTGTQHLRERERERGMVGKLSKMIGFLVYFSQKLKIITVNSESQENLPSDLPSKAGWRKAFMLAFGIAFSLVKTPVCFSSLWGSCRFGQAGTKPGM